MTTALIEKIAEILCTECEGVSYDSLPENVKYLECRADGGRAIADKDSARIIARLIMAEIYAELKESSEQMTFAARHLMMWLTGGRPSEKNLKMWCERRGLPVPVGCEDVDHIPPKAAMAAWVFEAMLAASPLAPEGGKD